MTATQRNTCCSEAYPVYWTFESATDMNVSNAVSETSDKYSISRWLIAENSLLKTCDVTAPNLNTRISQKISLQFIHFD